MSRIRDRRIRARGPRLHVRPAVEDDLDDVIRLIDEAGHWLKTQKSTDQWNKPWPDRDSRDKRVHDGISRGLSWVVMDGPTMAATVTITAVGNAALWTDEAQSVDAVYVHRLVIDRRYAGIGLGAELIDWAGEQGRRQQPGATSIRIDLWTTNEGLHAYYRGLGFLPCGVTRGSDDLPSGSMFERRLPVAPPSIPRLTTDPQP
ncbi:GNAT family N-acetyltransferase [Actinomadura barringtoniae]|uniref:GNAT family N-acetyltransferase n=1 Tax=Actinomadura barringtoniae TaxID=1427535 RepID=A0A939PMQ7_9ACTN|nr:GNAT family N-acetyltransferase [Actinomadura barringtoniae]MBO2454903.1 GNAT family N-acetyltransferase [Actinomadura barringtoniae]